MAHHRRCAATQMATDLASAATTPNYVWFAANEANNMEGNNDILFALSQIGDHQYDVKAGDKLLADMLPTILNSPAFQTQRTATGRQGHLVAGNYNNHYSLLRTIEDALQLPRLTNNDRFAQPMNEYWT